MQNVTPHWRPHCEAVQIVSREYRFLGPAEKINLSFLV